MLLLVDKREEDLLKEYEKASEVEAFHKVMRVSMFNNRPRLWMKQVCHYYMRNTKNQDFSQVNWENMNMAKKRR